MPQLWQSHHGDAVRWSDRGTADGVTRQTKAWVGDDWLVLVLIASNVGSRRYAFASVILFAGGKFPHPQKGDTSPELSL